MNHQAERERRVAIIGAGPAGLQAAIAAAENGASVNLIDGYAQPGGQYYKQLPASFNRRGTDLYQNEAAVIFERLHQQRITLHLQTQVLGISDAGRKLWLHGPDAPTELEAAAVILATGAYDRPAAFPGWTLPGVITLGAAQTAVKSQRVLPGKKLLLAGTGPLLLAAAAALSWAGAELVGVLEANTTMLHLPLHQWRGLWGQWSRLREGGRYLRALRQAQVPYRLGWGVVEALGTPQNGITGAVIAPLDEQWQPVSKKSQEVECDTICIGYGFIPDTTLSRLAGAAHTYQAQMGGWIPVRDSVLQTTIPGLYVAGDGSGIGGAVQSGWEGRIAGMTAASRLPIKKSDDNYLSKLGPASKQLAKQRTFQRLYARLFTPQAGIHTWAQADTVLCRCEKVTQESVAKAVGMGAETVTAVKGLTRAGMGACQGRLCSHLIAGQIAWLSEKSVAACGQLSARAPIYPLPISDIADEGEES